MKLLKKGIRWALLSFFVFLPLLILTCNLWVVQSTNQLVYRNSDQVPENQVGLVLGTSNKLTDGSPNPYFENRIRTAAELYKKGKVKHILVSGDNNDQYYNEPLNMRNALMEHGVPSSAITLDYAGFRTLDSVVRCKKVFGQHQVTIITQPFHSYRALFISRYHDIDAVAMTTREVPLSLSFKVRARELLARTVAIWDLYVAHKGPKFLGQREELKINV